ncbi:MAG: hypothetical protein GY862_22540 [Gammaproteobacteria bacterium]|nr:hypothetical protein [Gammaproteobacteria bacterium]
MENIDWGDKKITVREMTLEEVLSVMEAFGDADEKERISVLDVIQKKTEALQIPDNTPFKELPYSVAMTVQAKVEKTNHVFFSRLETIITQGREVLNTSSKPSEPPQSI